MKLIVSTLALVSLSALAQNSSIPLDQRYVMTRAGVTASQAEKTTVAPAVVQNPEIDKLKAQVDQLSNQLVKARETRDLMVAAPDWFIDPPEYTNLTVAVGTATSFNEQLAFDKARLAAERRLAEIVNSKVEALTKSYINETSTDSQENFEVVTRKVSVSDLKGVKALRVHIVRDGQRYKVYAMLGLPVVSGNEKRAWQELEQKTKPMTTEPAAEPMQHNGVVVTPLMQNIEKTPDNGVVERKGASLTIEEKQAIAGKVSDPVVKEKITDTLNKPNSVVVSTVVR